MNKNPMTALLLSFIPGAGHAYLGRPVRFVLYAGAFFGPPTILLLLLIFNSFNDGFAFFTLFTVAASWFINMVDMIITLISGKATGSPNAPPAYPDHSAAAPYSHADQREKSRTIMLSFLPGLGHMSIGLMQRGITFLISFIGLFAIVVFLSSIMNREELLVFLLVLPVIWIYSMFDVIAQLSAKQRGEQLVDRPIFEDLESHIASGNKSKLLAIALSIFPGAGHLYLGLQKRGLQLMAGFLLSIYIMDNLRLSLFFFLLPLFWCFAFFDALQQTARYERHELTDEPLLKQFVPYQRWFGIALLGFGVYYLLNRVIADYVRDHFTVEAYNTYMGTIYMIPTVVVSFVLIIVGLRLTFGTKTAAAPKQAPYPKHKEGSH